MTEALALLLGAIAAALWYERKGLHATIERVNQQGQQIQALMQGFAAQAKRPPQEPPQ